MMKGTPSIYNILVQPFVRTKSNILLYTEDNNNNVVCFLLGDSPASDLYMPTFRNTLSVPSSKAGVK